MARLHYRVECAREILFWVNHYQSRLNPQALQGRASSARIRSSGLGEVKSRRDADIFIVKIIYQVRIFAVSIMVIT